jgi:hypothetical protein
MDVSKIKIILNTIDHISAIYNVDTNQIKSKNNLIFNTNDYKQKKKKIVATLLPACSTREIIKDMIDAGVNVFRVNFSHADYADVKEKN